MRRILAILLFAAAANLSAYDIDGMVFVTDGSFTDVKNAVDDSTAEGSVYAVEIPPGTFTGWGSGGAINVDGPVHIYGAGKNATFLEGATSGSPTVFNVSAGATISDFTFTGKHSGTIAFNVTGTAGTNIGAVWENLKLDFTGNMGSRMFFIQRVYGVVAKCELVGGAGNNEYIYNRGPYDAWDYPANPGTDQAFYFENCLLSGLGYPDNNAAGRMVFRFCLITTASKLDQHGIESNGAPTRSGRLMEVYGSRWTWTSTSVGSSAAVEHRGGGGFYFDNIADASSALISRFTFNCYGYTGRWPNVGGIYQTPFYYPVPDQIGAGPGTVVPNGNGTQVGGAEPVYFWNNLKNGSRATITRPDPTDNTLLKTNAAGYSAGVTSITITGSGTGTSAFGAGNYFAIAGDTTRYLVTSGTTTNPGTITFTPALVNPISAVVTNLTVGPQTTYQGQMNDPNATWGANDLIGLDRDMFVEGATFNGTSGVGKGLRSDMDALDMSSGVVGVGFWVTDEGTWNQTVSGTVSVTTIEAGDYFEIVTPGDTDFTAMGARNSSAGTWAVATGPGIGSGMVKPRRGQLYTWNGSGWDLKYVPYTYPHPLRSGYVPPSVPTITDQPDSLTVTAGDAAAFSVTATSSGGTLTYQWRKGGVNISGATSSTYTIPVTVTGDAGSYSVVVTDDNGSTTSSYATLAVDDPEEPEPPATVPAHAHRTVGPASLTHP